MIKKSITLIALITIFSTFQTFAQKSRNFLTAGVINDKLGLSFEHQIQKTNTSLFVGIGFKNKNYNAWVKNDLFDNNTKYYNRINIHKFNISYSAGGKIYLQKIKQGFNFYLAPQITLSKNTTKYTQLDFFGIFQGLNSPSGYPSKDELKTITINKTIFAGSLSGGILMTKNHFVIDTSLGISINDDGSHKKASILTNVKLGYAF